MNSHSKICLGNITRCRNFLKLAYIANYVPEGAALAHWLAQTVLAHSEEPEWKKRGFECFVVVFSIKKRSAANAQFISHLHNMWLWRNRDTHHWLSLCNKLKCRHFIVMLCYLYQMTFLHCLFSWYKYFIPYSCRRASEGANYQKKPPRSYSQQTNSIPTC